MNKLIILLIVIAATLEIIGNARASEMLSRSEIRLLYDFTARVNQGVDQSNECLSEIYNFNSEGYSCTIYNIKLRILKAYKIRISNLSQESVNEYIANNNKLSRSFDDYEYILSVDISIRDKLKEIDKEIKEVIESINE